MTTIVCQQLAPRIGDLEANRELARGAIRRAVDARAEIVLLPELVTSGYVFETAEEARSMALRADDRLFDEWAAEAARGDAVIVGGFCELGEDGLVYNSAAIVDGSGVIGVHRKTHLWDREKLFFEPGREPPRVLSTGLGRIGVLICYELEFPELTRALALAGAELIAVPTNWPLEDRPDGERPAVVTIAMATAHINRVFIACCDRTGVERGQEWTAGTCVIDCGGWILDAQAEVGPARADVDLALARDKKLTELGDAFGDRRPELYGPVAQ